MSFESVKWLWKPSEEVAGGACPVVIERLRDRKGRYSYAVRQDRYCLSRRGEWEWEPSPSARSQAFLWRCRFDTWEAAANAILAFCKTKNGRFSEAVKQ